MASSDSLRSLDELKHAIRTCPIIDNHGHNLLRPHGQRHPNLLTITTEATGEALDDTPTSLAHLRAVRQLRTLYSLPPDADWDDILKKRSELLESAADALYMKCFEGTESVLIDDGLATVDVVEPYSWHDKFTRSPCKRIVRIETVAADILSALHQQDKLPVGVAVADEEACSLAWLAFITAFEQAIAAYVEDSEVVGFKSVVCYRTGLDIRVRRDVEMTEDGLRSFRRHYLPECVGREFRVEAKGMNDALVISTCKLIAAGYRQGNVAKPLQFHTGLGDNDINLLDSNPACLQPLIAHFKTVPIVLLHSSYPYTREAGYLATVYKNCYLDIGEVFPMISRDGQEKVLQQAVELTPWRKLLWSTDGHFYPETYWLANVQGREALDKVLCDYVKARDLEIGDAIRAVRTFFFDNSNELYGLGLRSEWRMQQQREETLPAAEETSQPPAVATTVSDERSDEALSRYNDFAKRQLSELTAGNPNINYVFVQWLDYMALIRTRGLPISEFTKLIRSDGNIRISNGNLGTLQNDHMTAVCNPVGSIGVKPDVQLVSLRPMLKPTTASVMAGFTEENGRPLSLCPRSALQDILDKFFKSYGVHFRVGFEIEITFCHRQYPRAAGSSSVEFTPLDNVHAWGTLTDEQYSTSLDIVLECADELERMGINVQQVHSEAGAGQYEYVLPPLPPIEAIDTLIQARQCIQQVAALKYLRATLHPQPFPGIGTAAHAHISFNRAPSSELANVDPIQMSFMAAVLEHMSSLCAITMPQAESYARVIDDSWTGGTWIAWGTENREVPLRKSDANRWEIRCLDGFANMYLALVAIFAIGLKGVQDGKEMTMKDCKANPTKLSESEKADIGITRKLPTRIRESIAAAEQDKELEAAMPKGMLNHYLTMKKAEQEMLNEMEETQRKNWLMERY